ncbi:MAG TPA: bacteriocin-protection protein, partial [Terriglobales bacterium]|nr:bacteriocin-protection protein [Terriglobales bacterium]
MKPRFFPTPSHFRRWLQKHHAQSGELWVGFYKRDSGKPSITWPEAVAQALCFGWIDGVRKSLDAASYVIRFTPRTPTSTWSAVNIT